MENKIKHLEMIQGVINRMANNSFKLKGWAVTLAAGIFALASKDTEKQYYLVVYLPVLVFWFLDSYYLFQERLYRALYNEIRKKDEKSIDFSMNAAPFNHSTKKNTFICCLISKTELLFYCPLAVVCTFVVAFPFICK